jgi:hypothetical protein
MKVWVFPFHEGKQYQGQAEASGHERCDVVSACRAYIHIWGSPEKKGIRTWDEQGRACLMGFTNQTPWIDINMCSLDVAHNLYI